MNKLAPARNFIAGAAIMYLFDPIAGNRRRAQARQRMMSWLHEFSNFLDVSLRDLSHRTRGVFCEARYRTMGTRHVTDDVLGQRIAAKMGRVVSHPRNLNIHVKDGIATLRGPILRHEVDPLVHAIGKVPGVSGVRDDLEVHSQKENVPSLQGGKSRPGSSLDMLQENWAPATRLLVGGAGLILAVMALRRPTVSNSMMGAAGLVLFGRGATNLPVKRLLGLGGGRRGISFRKTIHIKSSGQEVFDFFSTFTNFPLFMHNIRDVNDLGDGRSFWTARGPAGIDVTWTAVVTRHVPGKLIAWKSDQDSHLAHAGLIQFESTGDNGTRVSIVMSYNPPAGALGHVVASLFGADPKAEMESDLARAKTYLETGHVARDAAVVRRMVDRKAI